MEGLEESSEEEVVTGSQNGVQDGEDGDTEYYGTMVLQSKGVQINALIPEEGEGNLRVMIES